jgi:hypothetical protein
MCFYVESDEHKVDWENPAQRNFDRKYTGRVVQ